jgi:hypothetical protein
MKLTEKHIAYENDCRQMFVGQTIRAVIYGELKYYEDEEGQNINPEPAYKTNFLDIDSLDYSIYFKMDQETIYVFWDNTFFCYGLQSGKLDFTEKTNDYEQKWDVSSDIKWVDFVGENIVDFKIIWEEICSSNLEDYSNKVYIVYPQTFEIKTEKGNTIIVAAAEFKGAEKNGIYPFSDNLLVTTNVDLARQLKLIE